MTSAKEEGAKSKAENKINKNKKKRGKLKWHVEMLTKQ